MGNVWVLGSMGWMPGAGRQSACVLVELEGELIMLDAGTGVANLAQLEDVLRSHNRLTVLLSHYHLDHMVGLMYLSRFARDLQVEVRGPGRPVYPRSTRAYASDLLQRPFYAAGPMGFSRDVRYEDYGGEGFLVGRVPVRVRRQRHSSPSFELRLGDALTYATDTRFDADAWIGYPKTEVLLHECWQLDEADMRHTSIGALTTGLPHNTFGRVVLVHQNPAWTEDDRTKVGAIASSRGFMLASDGMHLLV